jgi:hypothetical protein
MEVSALASARQEQAAKRKHQEGTKGGRYRGGEKAVAARTVMKQHKEKGTGRVGSR